MCPGTAPARAPALSAPPQGAPGRLCCWTPAAIFWLGYQNWCGHLGASLDRDFASPGLLGVRWDGPAGGDTFRDPVAEPRPGSRSRAYVSGPSAGGWPKVAPMTQVSSQYGSYGDRRGAARPAQRMKKMGGYRSTCRDTAHLIRQIGRPDPSIRWSSGPPPAVGIDFQHPKDLEGLQSAFASTKTGLQRPAADLLVSRRTGRDARCRLVVRDATYKHVGLACRAQGANHTGFLPSCRTVSLIFCCLCAFCRAFLEGTTNAASRCCRFAL